MNDQVENTRLSRWARYAGTTVLGLGAWLWAIILVSYPGVAGGEWAFGFLHYVPSGMRWVLALIALSSIAAASGIFCRDPHSRRCPGWLLSVRVSKWGIVLTALTVLWLFRESTIWGDGLQLVAMLEGRDLPWNGPYFWREPLHYLLGRGVYLLLGFMGINSGLIAMALISCVAGALTVWVLLMLIESLVPDQVSRLILGALVLSVGAIQILFGHVEHYTLALLFSLAGLLALVRVEQHPWLIWLAIGLFVLGVFSHPLTMCILALPLAYVLLTHSYLRTHPARWLGVVVLSVSLVAALYLLARAVGAPRFPFLELLAGSFVGDSEVLLPLAAIFRLSHLRHLFNTFTANLPIVWLALPLMGVPRLLQRSRPKRMEVILWLSLIGASVFAVAFSPKIPPPIDWDLLAPFAFPAMLALGTSWLAGAPRSYAHQWGTALAILQLTWTIPWVGTNHFVTRVWPDALVPHRNLPYQIADLINLMPGAEIEVPAQSLCPDGDISRSECRAVTATRFAIQHSQLYDERPVLFAHPPSTITYNLELPQAPSFLWVCPALDPMVWDWPGDGVRFEVRIRIEGDTAWDQFYSLEVDKSGFNHRWHEAFIDLSAYAGQRIKLSLITAPRADPVGDRAGWGIAWIMRGKAEQSYQDLWLVYSMTGAP